MKRMKKFLGLGLGVAAVFGLASCSNGVNEPNTPNGPENVTLELVKAPDFYAWSGSQVLGDTRATRGTYEEDGNVYYKHDEEVEINLSVLDEHEYQGASVGDFVAKLSVHVRAAAEGVVVKLPLTANFIIDSDDLYIFHEHYTDGVYQGAYGNSFGEDLDDNESELSFTVEGVANPVNLKVEYGEAETTVTISGVTQEIIDACWNKNKDGLNFEVYIYLQTSKVENGQLVKLLNDEARASLISDLDESKVSFTGTNSPKYFINAFGYEYNDEGVKTSAKKVNDCVVKPIGSYSLVLGQEEGEDKMTSHLNGTPYNVIYIKTGEEADNHHGGSKDPFEAENGAE